MTRFKRLGAFALAGHPRHAGPYPGPAFAVDDMASGDGVDLTSVRAKIKAKDYAAATEPSCATLPRTPSRPTSTTCSGSRCARPATTRPRSPTTARRWSSSRTTRRRTSISASSSSKPASSTSPKTSSPSDGCGAPGARGAGGRGGGQALRDGPRPCPTGRGRSRFRALAASRGRSSVQWRQGASRANSGTLTPPSHTSAIHNPLVRVPNNGAEGGRDAAQRAFWPR